MAKEPPSERAEGVPVLSAVCEHRDREVCFCLFTVKPVPPQGTPMWWALLWGILLIYAVLLDKSHCKYFKPCSYKNK